MIAFMRVRRGSETSLTYAFKPDGAPPHNRERPELQPQLQPTGERSIKAILATSCRFRWGL